MKRMLIATLIAILATAPVSASWQRYGQLVNGQSLGYAVYTPNVETTFASTPDQGVTLPAGTRTVSITVENNPIRYFHGSTAVTGTLGLLLEEGFTYTLPNDPRLIATMRFIDSSAGASKVTVEYYGESRE